MIDLMAAEFAIRQLQARYVDALWRKDADAFAATFAADAEWKITGLHFKGREAIRQAFAGIAARLERCLMTCRTPIVGIVEGAVIARTYVTERTRFADGRTAATVGIYYDRFSQEEGAWRFGLRHFDLLTMGAADLSDPFLDVIDYGPPPGFPGPDAPTSARGSSSFGASGAGSG